MNKYRKPTADDWFFANWYVSRKRLPETAPGTELRKWLRMKSYRRVL